MRTKITLLTVFASLLGAGTAAAEIDFHQDQFQFFGDCTNVTLEVNPERPDPDSCRTMASVDFNFQDGFYVENVGEGMVQGICNMRVLTTIPANMVCAITEANFAGDAILEGRTARGRATLSYDLGGYAYAPMSVWVRTLDENGNGDNMDDWELRHDIDYIEELHCLPRDTDVIFKTNVKLMTFARGDDYSYVDVRDGGNVLKYRISCWPC